MSGCDHSYILGTQGRALLNTRHKQRFVKKHDGNRGSTISVPGKASAVREGPVHRLRHLANHVGALNRLEKRKKKPHYLKKEKNNNEAPDLTRWLSSMSAISKALFNFVHTIYCIILQVYRKAPTPKGSINPPFQHPRQELM
jgi:hypothetical protein